MEMGFTIAIGSGLVGLLLGVLVMWLFHRSQQQKHNADHAVERAMLHDRIQLMESNLQQTKERAAAEQIARDTKAQEQVDALAEMVAEAEQRLTQETERLATTETQLAIQKRENERLFVENQEVHIELGKLGPLLEEQQAQNIHLRDDLASMSDTKKALERRLQHSQETLDGANVEISTLQTELTALQNETITLRLNNQELTDAHRNIADKYYPLSNQYQEAIAQRTEVARELGAIQRLLNRVMTGLQPTQPASKKDSTTRTASPDKADEESATESARSTSTPKAPPQPPPQKAPPLPRPSPYNRAAQDVISRFLTDAEIAVTEFLPPQRNAPERLQLAQMLAEQYKPLKPLHKLLKRSLNDGNEHAMRFSSINQSTAQLMQEFGTLAESQRLLIHFDMSEHALSARSADTKDAQSFLSGTWMEQYIACQVEEIVAELQAEHTTPLLFGYWTNVQVDLPSGEHREMDMLFHVNSNMYWIEVKSSEYRQFIEKYTAISQYLPLDKSHTILVAAEPTQQDILYRNRYKLSIYAIHEFANRVRATLKADLQKK